MEWQNDVNVGKKVKGPGGQLSDCTAVRDTEQYWHATQRTRDMLEIKELVKHRRIRRIPKQDNYYDCGLYTLTYMEYFAHRTPNQIWPGFGGKGSSEMDCVWDDGDEKRCSFLGKTWFNQLNGSNLRGKLMIDLLGLMVQKAQKDGLSQELDSQIKQAQEYFEHFSASASGSEYHSPEEMAQNPSLSKPPQPPRRRSARTQRTLLWDKATDQQQPENSYHDQHELGLFDEHEERDLDDLGLGASGHNRREQADPDYVQDVEVQSTVDDNRYDPISDGEEAVDLPVQRGQAHVLTRVTRRHSAQEQTHHPPLPECNPTRHMSPPTPVVPAEGSTDNIDTDSTDDGGQYHQGCQPDHDDHHARRTYSHRPDGGSNGYAQDNEIFQHRRRVPADDDVAYIQSQ